MANFKIRCRLSFHYLTNELLKLFAAAVRTGIYTNVIIFAVPPILAAAFDALIADFNLKYENYKNRIGSKGDYLLSKTALMNALNTLADYVNGVALNDPEIILLAGYTPTKGSASNVPPPLAAQNVTITRGIPGTLTTDCDTVANADSYGVILVADNPLPDNITMNGLGQIQYTDDGIKPVPTGGGPTPEPTPGVVVIKALIDLNKNRRKTFINLEIGTTYYVYYWSMNAGGVSPLSEVVSKKVLEG